MSRDADVTSSASSDSSAEGDGKAFLPAAPARRCLGCFYVLDHLESQECPECGRWFDPADPVTYTTRPPFVWWRYWLPGFLLATGVGLLVGFVLVPITGFGWAVTLALPTMIGGIVGYDLRLGLWAGMLVAFAALLTFLAGLITGGMAGVFCFVVLFAMAVVPLGIGFAVGVTLRTVLKESRWQQRQWLPILAFYLLPLAVAAIELRLPPPPAVVVETSRELDAPLADAWDAVMFYEEVEHEPPWMLRLGLRSPRYTTGRASHVGDRKTCVYTRGKLTKEITAVRPLESLAFTVVEQEMFEDYSVRLTGGAFRFEPIDGQRTRVTLTTGYEPLLHPRWAWQPVEAHVVGLLHGHVLEGMAHEATRREHRPSIASAASSGESER